MVDFKREITHTSYKYEKQLKKYYHRVEKKITVFPIGLNKIKTWKANQDYIFMPSKGNFTPILGGGISWFLVISSFFNDDTFDGFGLYLFILFCILGTFFTLYYFTKPKKEQILNSVEYCRQGCK